MLQECLMMRNNALTSISLENVFIQAKFQIQKIDHQFKFQLLKLLFYFIQVDDDGKYNNKKATYCLSGFVRAKG